MERLGILIGKLQEQFNQGVPPQQMLITLQMIQKELASQQVDRDLNKSKVAVVLPGVVPVTADIPSSEIPSAGVQAPQENTNKVASVRKPLPAESYAEPAVSSLPPNPAFSYDPVKEVPTLAHQKEIVELNERMASKAESLNDRLRQDKQELGTILKEGPVKDLKKAIGINDRYLFINELFRGDETMYERSIKTINNFDILPEAEYWMERELKIKLGWNDHTPLVRHFYQQVRRRFS
ncbi:MAG TPA: hypothetical protein VIK74_01255 [Parasegetibacter sp.]